MLTYVLGSDPVLNQTIVGWHKQFYDELLGRYIYIRRDVTSCYGNANTYQASVEWVFETNDRGYRTLCGPSFTSLHRAQ